MTSSRAIVFLLTVFLAVLTLGSGAGAAEAYVHANTGFAFPAKVGDFTRVKVTPFNKDASDIEVDYNGAPITVHLACYVYPTFGPLKKHYEVCCGALEKSQPTAKLLGESRIALKKNGKTYEGFRAVYGFKDKFDGKTDQDLLSEVVVFQFQTYYVLYRITYAVPDQANAQEQVAGFIGKFVWPQEQEKPPTLPAN